MFSKKVFTLNIIPSYKQPKPFFLKKTQLRKMNRKHRNKPISRRSSRKSKISPLLTSRDHQQTQKQQNIGHSYFGDIEELEAVEVHMIPMNQLSLTDAELDSEFTKALSSINPNLPPKYTQFNNRRGEFVSFANDNHLAVHIKVEGVLWHENEAEQAADEEKQKYETEENEQNVTEENTETVELQAEDTKEEEIDIDDEKEEDVNDDAEKENKIQGKLKLVKNQFNYSERASQTFNQPLRDRSVLTEPAPKSVFSQNASAFTIRDEYLHNLFKVKQQQANEEKNKKLSSAMTTDGAVENVEHDQESDALLHSKSMLKALKIMERVIQLNAKSVLFLYHTYFLCIFCKQESYHAFRYYKPSESKVKHASLKQLWTFKYGPAYKKNKMVTSLCWNTKHFDLFAVGYGSYNFHKQTSGLICVFSLKSSAHPEKIIHCESGIMCMAFHPKYASLLCVGSYDGSVSVYDIRNRDSSPIYSSENPDTQHTDPVWDIRWHNSDLLNHELSFFSISSDGLLKQWKMNQNELNHQTIAELKNPVQNITNVLLTSTPLKNTTEEKTNNVSVNTNIDTGNKKIVRVIENENDILSLSSCSCFDFNPSMEHLFLVGTEDGFVFECSRTYTDGSFVSYYTGHDMNVYAVKWNPFHHKTFLTCSEDWYVKLWDADEELPIISYDLNTAVNDICWAPYSSTVFAAVTSDGRVHVWDLCQNKNAPLCSLRVTRRCGLTHVSFPRGDFPIIIVGDEKGCVYCLKLSPHLYYKQKKQNMDQRGSEKSGNVDGSGSLNPFGIDINIEKKKLEKVLKVTGTKVLDLVQHLSPMKSPMKSPMRSTMLRSPIKSPFAKRIQSPHRA